MMKNPKLYLCLTAALFVYLIPTSWIPIEGLTVIEHRVMALFVLAALMWVLEPIPVYATSVLIIVLQLIMISDRGLILFRGSADDPTFGTMISYQSIMATFASPIILLFLGGFFLAMATSKYRLDINLARILLRPFGSNPRFIMLGLMIITALFSMFMSNTATTAMMFAILVPVLKAFDPQDRGRVAFILAIPFAANVGGIGTPIGTPPNAIGLRYLTGEHAISFGEWMLFAIPFVAVVMLFIWGFLLFLYPPQSNRMELKLEGRFLTHWRAWVLYITFIGVIILWMTEAFHGMNSYVVAMIPVAVFSVTQIITADDLKNISWDVLWLVAGGIALGLGLEGSGLSRNLVESIPFATFSPILIVLLCSIVTYFMATFMSNTATANLLMPIVAALGVALPTLEPLGGAPMLILSVTFASSLAMSLPISTPPNAIAYASGQLQSRDMMFPGLVIGFLGLALTFVLMTILNAIGFI